ncbi:MAG TPA: Holliday junction resolvase RuvX [Acidimicrobiia bacterium]|nr:Holliday junction resolvase RuvX [Acidimicrobiia bacterium]
MTRILGVDYGSKRIGLAISDGIGLTARPLQTIRRGELQSTLRGLAEEYDIGEVVIGLPRSLSGNEGESAVAARELAAEIQEILGVEAHFVDERFTTRLAESALLESGMKRRERKETVDRVAAAIILQTYLDYRRREGNSPDTDDVESTGNQ